MTKKPRGNALIINIENFKDIGKKLFTHSKFYPA